MFPANARTLLLRPSGRGVLLGDDNYNFPVVGKSRHRTAIDKLSNGRKLRCAALLTRAGRDYDRYGVMVTIRGQEVGFLPYIDGRDFRHRLREAGFLEAVCKAEITGEHVFGDSWDYVGVAIDAFLPFTFMSPEEWHNQHTPTDEREPAVRGSHQKIVRVIESLGQSFLKASRLRGWRNADWARPLRWTGSRISPPEKPEAGTLPSQRAFPIAER
jgi:hypothetical protein